MIRQYPLTLISNQTLVKEKPAFSQASRAAILLENSGFPGPHTPPFKRSSFTPFVAPQGTGENRLAPPSPRAGPSELVPLTRGKDRDVAWKGPSRFGLTSLRWGITVLLLR